VNRTGINRWTAAGIVVTAALLLTGCHSTAVFRRGPAEERRVMRTYPVPLQALRADMLSGFATQRSTLPSPSIR
jgi:hypothetical protein